MGTPIPSLMTMAASGADLKEGVINHGLTPEPSILSSNSTSDWQCFRAMIGSGTKKKKLKKQGQVNSGCVRIDSADPDVLKRLWKKRRKL